MIKILICDDEAIIRQGIRKILENFYGDIEVRECGDGMEGYKTMAVWNPDAVITDIRMPVLDGLAMIEKALAAGITTQYVVISAYRDFEYARTAIRCGVREYILKPVNRFELTDCTSRLLGIREQAETKEEKGTVPEESGSSLRAVGFQVDGVVHSPSGGWNAPSRPRSTRRYPSGDKVRWVLHTP